jgi:glycosidase
MGVQSPIFQEALRNTKSQYHNWFEWNEDGTPVYWGGFTNMPQCNKYNPDYQDYACKVTLKYIKMGADAIRLDLGENLPPEFMRKYRERIKAVNPEVLIVNEMWGFDNHREYPQLDS